MTPITTAADGPAPRALAAADNIQRAIVRCALHDTCHWFELVQARCPECTAVRKARTDLCCSRHQDEEDLFAERARVALLLDYETGQDDRMTRLTWPWPTCASSPARSVGRSPCARTGRPPSPRRLPPSLSGSRAGCAPAIGTVHGHQVPGPRPEPQAARGPDHPRLHRGMTGDGRASVAGHPTSADSFTWATRAAPRATGAGGSAGTVPPATRHREPLTLTGITVQIDQLRAGIEALAAKVRRHEEQLRRSTRP